MFFHVQASARHHRNFIHSLEHEGHELVTEDNKATGIYDYFGSIMGTAPSRSCSTAFDDLDLPHLELGRMCAHFMEAEVWAVISSLPQDKAPGSDGFLVRFFQVAWHIICLDIMQALEAFWRQDMRNLHDVNGALMVLLP
jgi:hypothetical protein